MCNIRGYRHTCDHVDYRFISICRATFSTKSSPNQPLCLARDCSEITISIDDQCLSCSFQAFKQEWERRINEMEKKRDDFQTRLSGSEVQESVWLDSPSWGSDDEWVTESWYEFDSHADVSPDEAGENCDANLSPDEEIYLKNEVAAAQTEVENLRQQYGQELWQNWQGYYNPSIWTTPSKRPSTWKRRGVSQKVCCRSPLKQVTNADEKFESETSKNEHSHFVEINTTNESTDAESDCSDSPTPSLCSAFSDDTSVDDLVEDAGTNEKEMGAGTSATIFNFNRYTDDSCSIVHLEDSEADMLPDWFDFH